MAYAKIKANSIRIMPNLQLRLSTDFGPLLEGMGCMLKISQDVLTLSLVPQPVIKYGPAPFGMEHVYKPHQPNKDSGSRFLHTRNLFIHAGYESKNVAGDYRATYLKDSKVIVIDLRSRLGA